MSLLSITIGKWRHVLLYSISMAFLIFILKWLQWKYLVADNSIEIYVGLVALIFTTLGVWIAAQLTTQKIKTVVVEKEIFRESKPENKIDQNALELLNLTARELEVLQLLKQGKSNAEIATHLFLSLSTIKTHVSNLYVKLDVKNRVQAIEKANKLKIIA